MAFEGLRLQDIDAEAIRALHENSVPEDKHLDYKRDPIGASDREKLEFLQDVSGLANAGGGYLVVGVEEKKGIPVGIPGLELENPDAEIGRLTQTLRDNIRPPISGLSMRAVPMNENSYVLLIRVPRPSYPPHQVVRGSTRRIIGRDSHGNYPMPIDEIRELVVASEAVVERIAQFRKDRVDAVTSQPPIASVYEVGQSLLLYHLAPLESFARLGAPAKINLYGMEPADIIKLQPLYGHTNDYSFTLEGYVNYSANRSYLHVYLSGPLEGLTNLASPDEQWEFSLSFWEDRLLNRTAAYIDYLEGEGFSAPFVLMVSILDADRLTPVAGKASFQDTGSFQGRRLLEFAPALLTENEAVETTMRPLFDAMWRAAGFSGSPHYGADGSRSALE